MSYQLLAAVASLGGVWSVSGGRRAWQPPRREVRQGVKHIREKGGSVAAPVELEAVAIEKPGDANVIVGQAHFIKTVEDLHEALTGVSPQLKFGIGFCEASGACLVRRSGNDAELTRLAAQNALAISAGHSFVVLLREGFPLNVLNPLKAVPEVCTVFCATANPVQVLVAATGQGRGVVGVIDGSPPVGIEQDTDVADRHALLRAIGYKL
jgi:adenosine/AMP kinase